MRWIDKPRKKTRREVVLEYIKFLKIMGFYSNVVANMYRLSKLRSHFATVNKWGTLSMKECKILAHNEWMIKYFEGRLYYARELNKWRIKELFIYDILSLNYKDSNDALHLLWSYFEEKHIANCILVD